MKSEKFRIGSAYDRLCMFVSASPYGGGAPPFNKGGSLPYEL